MIIVGQRFILGPNVFHSNPVLVTRVDLQQWTDVGSHDLPGFSEKLLAALPGLQKHTCSPGYEGGFVERLQRGTYLAHIMEHVGIELANQAGMQISYGKTNYAGKPGLYDIIVRCLNDLAMRTTMKTAFELVQSLLENRPYDLQPHIHQIRRTYCETKLGPSGQCLLEAAQRRGIPCRPLAYGSLLQLGYGKYRRRVQAAVSDKTSLIASEMVQDKEFTKRLLSDASVPVPFGMVVHNEEELLHISENFPGPYAVKPVDGHHGEGVVLNLKTREELFKAYYMAKEFCPEVLVEEMCPGRDYRVLIIGGKLSAAAERFPPRVLGDGHATIQQLIDLLNSDERRGEGHESFLTRVAIDDNVLDCLKRQGFHLNSVPRKDEYVLLRANANLSSGGTAKDVTDEVHAEVRALCERIARIVDLDICGIDIIARDLATPLDDSFKVIEVNAGPGLRMHLSPAEGKARNVGDDIINMLYPPGSESRIPIVAVTGTNGKTTTVRLIHKILSGNSKVGLTTSDGVYIGNEKVTSGDTTGPASAQIVLSDPSVEKAVLEVARGGILRRGLAYDWSDVGIVTNIRPDHIGQDGIETLEDLVWIKSLVAERVKSGGSLVLNADDEESLKLRTSPRIQRTPKRFFLYSVRSNNPDLYEHLKAGGDGAWCEDGWLFLKMSGKIYRLVATQNLKFTFEGRATFQVSNALAAICASAAVGATPNEIMMGLMSFQSTTENRGRLNLYKVREGYVILDYGHNPDAIGALGELVSTYKGYPNTAVFGLPGDRADEIIQLSAEKMAQYFDRLIVRDDHDLRGRKPSEVPEMIGKVVRDKFSHVDCRQVASEREAIETALDHLRKNEIVVVLYDDIETVMPLIRQYDPMPVLSIPFVEAKPEVERSEPKLEKATANAHHGAV